jgi:type I restriction enzyme S subunit
VKTLRVAIESLWLGLYDGPHATPRPSNNGPIFLGIGNLTEKGRLDLTDIRHISEEDFGNWTRRVLPQAGDIVFTYEATLNRYAMIPEDFRGCLGRRLALIRPDSSKVNPRFLFSYFFGEDWRETISRNILSGATVDRIPLTTFPTFEVNLPSRLEQDRIVEILSAYDELIENNARRIKILEEMAQMICREWFLNFRFPGHERSKMVDSELGLIPAGWRVGLLREMCESIDYGHTASAAIEPIGPKFLRITDIVPNTIDWSAVPYCPQPDRNPQKYRLLEGDIVVARTGATTGYAKRLNKRHPESIFASYLVRLRLKPEHSNSMVGLMLESDDYKRFIKANIGGAAQPQANAQVLTSKPIAIPPSDLQAVFSAVVEPLLDQKEILQIKNANLSQTRDLLLPKLISGEVSVEYLEAEAVSRVS